MLLTILAFILIIASSICIIFLSVKPIDNKKRKVFKYTAKILSFIFIVLSVFAFVLIIFVNLSLNSSQNRYSANNSAIRNKLLNYCEYYEELSSYEKTIALQEINDYNSHTKYRSDFASNFNNYWFAYKNYNIEIAYIPVPTE